MELPFELRAAVEAEAARWPAPALSAAAAALSTRYRTESGAGKRLLTTDTEAAAYAAVRMPATYGAVYTALSWAKEVWDEKTPLPDSLLDVGAGTGASGWAVAEHWGETLQSAVFLEKERAMRTLGARLMEASPRQALRAARWQPFDLTAGALPATAQLVTASYVLNELSDADRLAVTKKLWAATGQLLLLVEPGTPVGFAQLKKARETLVAEGAYVLAPCPAVGACPLAAGDWCHFTCRVARSRLHRGLKGADAPFEDEKFAFLALVRTPMAQAAGRVLRHPRMETGRVELSLCTPGGVRQLVLRKKDGESYKKARKLSAGDAFAGPQG